MSYFGNVDFSSKVALGDIPGWVSINKFGRTTNADNGARTDIWDGADTVPTSTIIWVAPTQARVHAIVSASANDTNSAGTGARTLRVYGLTSWSAAETSEDINLNGTTPVNTSNSYVIIHRMKCLTFGSGGINAGIIKATAATDSTVTAAIQASSGQTQMAIYGVPSGKSFLIKHITSTILRATGATARGDFRLAVKENSDQSTSGFVVKRVWAASGDDSFISSHDPPAKYDGPCIIKMQVTSTVDNSQVTGQFDGFLVDN